MVEPEIPIPEEYLLQEVCQSLKAYHKFLA